MAVGYDGTFEGLLTIIFLHYYEKLDAGIVVEEKNGLSADYPRLIFTEYVSVETDYEKAERVLAGLRKKSAEAAENLFAAFLCASRDATELYRYAVLVFSKGKAAENFEATDCVRAVHNAAQTSQYEAHRYTGFIRFTETERGVLYAKFEPVNRVLALVAPHFASRMPGEKWVIEDRAHREAAIYDGNELMITEIESRGAAVPGEVEDKYERLWGLFVDTIAVEGRMSEKRRNQIFPKRFRKFLPEFKKDF